MQIHSIANPQNVLARATQRLQPRKTFFTIAGALIAIAGIGLQSAFAGSNEQEDARGWDHTRVCTLATLEGRYLFAESGVLLPPAFGVTTPTQAADAGVHTFNGNGTGSDTLTFRMGTQVVLENAVSPLAYTVNSNCTGTISVLNGPSFDIFIAPDGDSFASIATAPAGNYATSVIHRVSKK
jgi:hypothetical protein